MRRSDHSAQALCLLLLVIAGCAGPGRFVQPSDFPAHATDHPFFDLHWRLDRRAGWVTAVGVVEAPRKDGIAEVILELRGVDAQGRVVSRGRGHTHGGPLYRGRSQPFVVSLRPTGSEVRFDLEVWSFRWDTRDGGESTRGL